MKKRLKINGVIIFFAVLLIAFVPGLFFRKDLENSLDEIAEIFGVAFILLGQIFRVSSRGHKSEHSLNGSALVHTGAYSLVRNPMYLGIFLIGLGVVLMLFNWWAGLAFLVIFYIRYLLLIFKEEKKLRETFRGEYQDYCRKVPRRIFPSLSDLINREISGYLPIKTLWLLKEIGSILAVLLLTLLIESWRDIRQEGLGLYLKETSGVFVTVALFICLIVYLSKNNKVNA